MTQTMIVFLVKRRSNYDARKKKKRDGMMYGGKRDGMMYGGMRDKKMYGGEAQARRTAHVRNTVADAMPKAGAN